MSHSGSGSGAHLFCTQGSDDSDEDDAERGHGELQTSSRINQGRCLFLSRMQTCARGMLFAGGGGFLRLLQGHLVHLVVFVPVPLSRFWQLDMAYLCSCSRVMLDIDAGQRWHAYSSASWLPSASIFSYILHAEACGHQHRDTICNHSTRLTWPRVASCRTNSCFCAKQEVHANTDVQPPPRMPATRVRAELAGLSTIALRLLMGGDCL